MPFDPFSLTVAAPWVYAQAKKEHCCIKCGNWKLNIEKVSSCCNNAICNSCVPRWLIKRNGVATCPSCGHEFE